MPRPAVRLAARAAILVFLAGAGCTVGPDYTAPTSVVPDAFAGADSRTSTAAATAGLSTWWTMFGDPVLDDLERRAIEANLDLAVATARVREARALRRAAGADEEPQVDFDGTAVRERASRSNPGAGPGATHSLFNAGFDASFELDLFGAVRRRVEAAEADFGVAVAARSDVLGSVVAEVAREYVEMRAFQRRAAVAADDLKTQRETVEVTAKRLEAGTGTELDIVRARGLAHATESEIPRLEAGAALAAHLLCVLIGRGPDALSAELGVPGAIPPPPPPIPIGVPSELLRRRPDVRRAERELAAATARVGVATADLFPRFSLTGSFGLESTKPTRFLEGASSFWSLGPAVSWPIFDGGRIRAQIDAADARMDEAATRYEQAVLTSLKDVEDALVAYGKDLRRHDLLLAAHADNRRAFELASAAYERSGLVPFLDVLEAERQMHLGEDALVQGDRDLATDVVALCKALGGGWDPPDAAMVRGAGGTASH